MEDIAIIGGADGPTAIYVAGGVEFFTAATALLLAVAVVIWLFKRKKKK